MKTKTMSNDSLYRVVTSIGRFSDEAAFKNKYISIVRNDKDRFKEILAIENTVEPGMPDLILVDNKDRSYFVEVKYAKKGIISFKKTQIPWYRRHQHMNISVLAYNDLTQNIHVIDASVILLKAETTLYRLEAESSFKLEEKI